MWTVFYVLSIALQLTICLSFHRIQNPVYRRDCILFQCRDPTKLRNAIAMPIFFSALFFTVPTISLADNTATLSPNTKLYVSGRSINPPNKDDPKAGTKKDIKFLRCLSSCKSKCQLPSAGLAEDRYDCVQDCQDICCESYEQCSFKLKAMQ